MEEGKSGKNNGVRFYATTGDSKFDYTRKAYLVAGTPYALDVMNAMCKGARTPREVADKAGVTVGRLCSIMRRLLEADLVTEDMYLTRTGLWLLNAAGDLEHARKDPEYFKKGDGHADNGS